MAIGTDVIAYYQSATLNFEARFLNLMWNAIRSLFAWGVYIIRVCSSLQEWGLCEYVIVHTILGGSPVILWISLGGMPKWLPLKFGYRDAMCTSPKKGIVGKGGCKLARICVFMHVQIELRWQVHHEPCCPLQKFAVCRITESLILRKKVSMSNSRVGWQKGITFNCTQAKPSYHRNSVCTHTS